MCSGSKRTSLPAGRCSSGPMLSCGTLPAIAAEAMTDVVMRDEMSLMVILRVVVAALLPWLAHAALGFADPEADRRWRAAWRTALLLALGTAFAPGLWFFALLLGLIVTAAATVVVRGGDAMPIRDPLPLKLPKEAVDAAEAEQAAAEQAGLEQLGPGPTITETR